MSAPRRLQGVVSLLVLASFLPGRPAFGQTRHTVMSDGHPMAVWEKRPADAARAAVVLLHGRTWSGLPDFDLQVPGEELSLMDGLTGRGYAVYALDQRGYGATPRDETGWLTPDRAAEDLAAILLWVRGREAERPVHLFGWSQGSMVSQLTAQRHGELVDRLVLFGYPFRPGAQLAHEEPAGPPPARTTTAEAAASDFITPGAISDAAVAAYVEAALAADPVRVDWTRTHQWNALDPAQVRVPTLVMRGEHDPLAPQPTVEAFFSGLGTQDRALIVVAGGDHAAFLERPRAYFLDVLDAFLTGGAGR
ncbi:MAG TPA: alpha/beta fold hydrolase [Longimicrobiales bacterium]|nr:alpha/beta fold hydrolase [Longimicrobiales bacterium]